MRLFFTLLIISLLSCISSNPPEPTEQDIPEKPVLEVEDPAETTAPSLIAEVEEEVVLEEEEQNTVVVTEVPPPEESIVTRLSQFQISQMVLKKVQKEGTPVIQRGKPAIFLWDLNGDDLKDACILLVNGEFESQDEDGVPSYLDPASLYSDSAPVLNFAVAIYLQSEEKMELHSIQELGLYKVVDTIDSFNLKDGQVSIPAIRCSFITRKGKDDLIFTMPDLSSTTVFRAVQNPISWHEYRDIDNDGTIDIVNYQRVLEDNIGYETYISWYGWYDNEYVLYDSTNILRNLNEFLIGFKQALLSGEGEQFIYDHVDMDSNAAITNHSCAQVFKDTDSGQISSPCDNLNGVIFQEVLENPFYIREDGRQIAVLDVRLDYKNSGSRFYNLTLLLNSNPFNGEMFQFIVLE